MSDANRLMGVGVPMATAVEIARQIKESGGVAPASPVPNSTATDVAGVVADFNALLAALRNAGVIST